MNEVIALASPSHPYLAIFDEDKTLALYHSKRLASPSSVWYCLAEIAAAPAPAAPSPATTPRYTTWRAG